MEKFDPLFTERSTDELVSISHGLEGDWQQNSIAAANSELLNQGVDQKERETLKKVFLIRKKQVRKEELARRAVEDYSSFQKIMRIIFWYEALFHDWFLRRNGHALKSKKRLQLIGFGFILYLFFIYSFSFI